MVYHESVPALRARDHDTEAKDRQVKIAIANTGPADAFLSELAVTWPETVNGLLKKVKIGGDVVYDNPDLAGGSATLNAAHVRYEQAENREGEDRGTHPRVQNNVDTNLLHYVLTAKFGDCVVTLQ